MIAICKQSDIETHIIIVNIILHSKFKSHRQLLNCIMQQQPKLIISRFHFG